MFSTRWLLNHTSPWTGLRCVREDCDGVGHISVASAFAQQGIELSQSEEMD